MSSEQKSLVLRCQAVIGQNDAGQRTCLVSSEALTSFRSLSLISLSLISLSLFRLLADGSTVSSLSQPPIPPCSFCRRRPVPQKPQIAHDRHIQTEQGCNKRQAVGGPLRATVKTSHCCPNMALPKRIIKETERLMAEP